jgi:malto-oligosyltrehalose trehalohydrolase
MATFRHPLPFGATLQADGTTRFRLWAPDAQAVSVVVDELAPAAMRPAGGGWYEAVLRCGAGAHYRYRLPDGLLVPDPASRLQHGDVHASSVVLDPEAYVWHNAEWQGRPWHEAVIYELHAGAMGGFNGIADRLEYLRDLGVSAIELMPIADFPGRRNWGYDGVLPYAPDEAYGTPDELKMLIDKAHGLGLTMLLDVVYNHFGPDGNYLPAYAGSFFDAELETLWGAAIDFRRPEVCDFFIHNALYWLNEYRFDGLRFDAVQAIGRQEFLLELAAAVRAGIAPGRHVALVLENGDNRASLLGPGKFDAQWTDDAHHALHVLLTGESDGYYSDFQDAAALLARALGEGFACQGQAAPVGARRGEPSAHLPPTAFVYYLQNHDQIGNRAFGERLTRLAHPEALLAATALLLLIPQIPLLFMGEECASGTPFLYFTDLAPKLAAAVRDGRDREYAQFAAFADERLRARIPDANAPATFACSIPDPAERDATVEATYRRLLGLRRRHIIPRLPGTTSRGAAPLGRSGVIASWALGDGARLTVASNLGASPLPVGNLEGPLLFESRPGDLKAVRSGWLPAYSTVALLADPA